MPPAANRRPYAVRHRLTCRGFPAAGPRGGPREAVPHSPDRRVAGGRGRSTQPRSGTPARL